VTTRSYHGTSLLPQPAGRTPRRAHHQSHALEAGVTPDQPAGIASFETSEAFDSLERAVMGLAHESTVNVQVSDERWAAVRAHLSDKEMVELVLTIAWYNSGVRIMGLLDIDLEAAPIERDVVIEGGV
jgi:alkylhydroperoxidase family enzyme